MSIIRRSVSVFKEEGAASLIRRSAEFISKKLRGENSTAGSYPLNSSQLADLSDAELLSIVQHEAHRIEKAVYNEILSDKFEKYSTKSQRVDNCIEILVNERGFEIGNPIISWAIDIQKIMDEESPTWISRRSSQTPEIHLDNMVNFTDLLKSRRSTRTWADNQPSEKRLRKIAYQMIEGAKWAPNSGNRQAWRFKIIIDDEKKKLLDGIKEEHTVSAPLLIFVGMDTRLYGDVADSETSIYLDAGAAIMQMVLTAHNAGLGTCWNHFGKDLIKSRESNKEDYQKFTNRLDIPDYIEPMAIVCVGKPEFIPPIPERSDNERYIIS